MELKLYILSWMMWKTVSASNNGEDTHASGQCYVPVLKSYGWARKHIQKCLPSIVSAGKSNKRAKSPQENGTCETHTKMIWSISSILIHITIKIMSYEMKTAQECIEH